MYNRGIKASPNNSSKYLALVELAQAAVQTVTSLLKECFVITSTVATSPT